MKIYPIVLLILFVFQPGMRYDVTNYTCENNEIKIQYKENWYILELFNVYLKEDVDVCGYLGEEIAFELEKEISLKDTLEVYLFVGDDLLQKRLIEEGKALVKNNSYAYKYRFDVKKERVIASVEEKEGKNLQSRNIGVIVVVVYGLWMLVWLYQRSCMQKDINKDKNDV